MLHHKLQVTNCNKSLCYIVRIGRTDRRFRWLLECFWNPSISTDLQYCQRSNTSGCRLDADQSRAMQSTSDSGWWLRGHGGLCCGVLHVNLKLVCVDILAELCSVHQHRPTALLLGQPTTNHSPDSYTRTHRRTCPTHTHVTHKVGEHWARCSFLMHTHTPV